MPPCLFPRTTFRFPVQVFWRHLNNRAAELLDLIHQKGQHHQVNKHLAQALLQGRSYGRTGTPGSLQGVEVSFSIFTGPWHHGE